MSSEAAMIVPLLNVLPLLPTLPRVKCWICWGCDCGPLCGRWGWPSPGGTPPSSDSDIEQLVIHLPNIDQLLDFDQPFWPWTVDPYHYYESSSEEFTDPGYDDLADHDAAPELPEDWSPF